MFFSRIRGGPAYIQLLSLRLYGFILLSALIRFHSKQSYPGLPDFSWYNIPKREKYIYQITKKLPIVQKVYQMAVK
jgi:hypothetical protein